MLPERPSDKSFLGINVEGLPVKMFPRAVGRSRGNKEDGGADHVGVRRAR
jgi:hypothetical protein